MSPEAQTQRRYGTDKDRNLIYTRFIYTKRLGKKLRFLHLPQ